MNISTTSRLAAVVGPAVAAALVLGACGADNSSAASKPTVSLAGGETSYATIAPETTTTVAEESTGSTPSGPVTEYEVQAGDYPLLITEMFEISLDDLAAANGWSDAATEFPGPGAVIKIPPGAKTPDEESSSESEAGDEPTGDTVEDPGDGCEAGSYTLESNDYPLRVAAKFDVSVDEMNAANSETPGYSAFYEGLKIVIPPKEGC